MREPGEGDAAVVRAAQAALLEVTAPETVGPLKGLEESVDGVVDVRFVPTMPGYPGWQWSVSVSTVDGVDAPSVLELGLLPADGALLAPDWVPWSERLADYRAAQEAKGEAAELGDEDDDDEDRDDETLAEDLDETDLLGDDEDDVLDGVDFESAEDHESEDGESAEGDDSDGDEDFDDDDDLDEDEDDDLDEDDDVDEDGRSR